MNSSLGFFIFTILFKFSPIGSNFRLF